MKNEIGRKLTSLTLMTIMVAGGLTFAVPGVMPEAHAANANLFVSAENSQFSNYMSGPQVIEVVVIDSDIDDTDEAKGEPDVTVNGKIIRMAQAVDGNWYGYFADRNQALLADATANGEATAAASLGTGLDFGNFCSAASAGTYLGPDFSDTVGVAIPPDGAAGEGVDGGAGTAPFGGPITEGCGAGTPASANGTIINVVREQKDLNTNAGANPAGQLLITNAAQWPFIQLYPLNPTGNVVIQYNKGGGAQTTTLTFDTVEDFASIAKDRTVYPQGGEVHVTVTDLWLNIDPTDEDSWTFGTNATGDLSTNYQVFDENGNQLGSSHALGIDDLNVVGTPNLSDLMIEDNGILILDVDAQSTGTSVLTLQDNDDSAITCTVAQDASTCSADGGNGLAAFSTPITITELGPKSGIFGTYDESDVSVIKVTDDAGRGTSGTVDYNETPTTILVGFDYASIDMQPVDDEWNSGEEIPVVLVDGDANKNSRADEDLDLNDGSVALIPSLQTGSPFTLGSGSNFNATYQTTVIDDEDGIGDRFETAAEKATYDGVQAGLPCSTLSTTGTSCEVQAFSQRAIVAPNGATASIDGVVIDLGTTMQTLLDTIQDTRTPAPRLIGTNLLNYDVRGLDSEVTVVDIFLVNNTADPLAPDTSIFQVDGNINASATFMQLVDDGATTGLVSMNTTNLLTDLFSIASTDSIGIAISSTTPFTTATADVNAYVVDFFSFGFSDDGVQSGERVASQIVRLELEESGVNTSTFEGSLEYIMINQLNIAVESTYLGLGPIADDPNFIVIEDLTDEDSPRVNYNDRAGDGTILPVADQEEAPSHSGVVSFDLSTYKIADTVVITLQDADLNVDSDLIDIFTVVGAGDIATDAVGAAGLPGGFSFGDLGHMVDITFDDVQWVTSTGVCTASDPTNSGLGATGFTLIETDIASGTFMGDFAVAADWCRASTGSAETTTGLDIEVNYLDFRDASGEIIEVGDSAGIRANTGSVSLDRTVYPVPFGDPTDFTITTETSPKGFSIFGIHATGVNTGETIATTGNFLSTGDLTIHVRVNDPDFDISPEGEDIIGADTAAAAVGPVKISIIRGANSVVLGYAGGPAAESGLIDVGDNSPTTAREFGPITEIAPDAGIFEIDIPIRYTDGPNSATCPPTTSFTALDGTPGTAEVNRFDAASADEYCILQGDILQIQYTDPEDASGDINTVTDSATFDLRNGVLQSDKSVYIIGSDMILTLIEPDFDLDNDGAETYDLDLIEWDSDAATITMGDADGENLAFDPEPTDFRETGDSTGIFQIVIEIPEVLVNDRLERGEEIILEYTDWGPSGSDFVGDEDEDVNLTIFTSNFGATVELDQKVYTWTDKIYVTIVAPDHNFDSDLVDEIGETSLDPIKVATRGFKLDEYKLVETGTDTGIFTGEVILTGFQHDADGDVATGDATTGSDTNPRTTGAGPTNGFLQSDDDDGITVSFEFSEDETVVGSALVRWNIGETQWLEASYPASGTGVVRIIDPDMNLDPEAVDNFDVDVWSDSDAGGIDLTVTETNEATGIFEGTVFFTTTDESSGHRLRVSEGDTITSEYEDNTLPDPYTTADELDITGTSLIGTIVPPLERAPAANARVVDAFGNSLASVSVDQQVQISADLANGQDREQSFAYLVQVQDGNGVTVALAWISGSLSAGQSFSPALSWTPDAPGTYEATIFVWESVDNPTALSPPVSVSISVS